MSSGEPRSGYAEALSRRVTRVRDPRILILTVAVLLLTDIPLARHGNGYAWAALSVLLTLWQFWRHGRLSWAALTAVTAITLLMYGLSIAGVIHLGQPGWWIPITGVANIAALAILLSPPIRRWVAGQATPSL